LLNKFVSAALDCQTTKHLLYWMGPLAVHFLQCILTTLGVYASSRRYAWRRPPYAVVGTSGLFGLLGHRAFLYGKERLRHRFTLRRAQAEVDLLAMNQHDSAPDPPLAPKRQKEEEEEPNKKAAAVEESPTAPYYPDAANVEVAEEEKKP